MKSLKTVWYWWWGWNPVHMEAMLERMEASGWKLFQVDFFGLRFRFKRGQEETVRYSVDYQPETDEDYLSIFEEDGWQMKWTGAGGWYLWRKPYTAHRPDIFTENSSLIDRNNRLLSLLTPLFYMLVIIFAFLLILGYEKFQWLIGLYVVIIALYIYMLHQLRRYNEKLKDEIRE